ncbi:MFS transporter [Flaviaesturariibacter flavus]|uniref:MFS transporter n=2 Tax=Flaviaesturariibacter flavus TaxID=2502780 RepID=A0A4R1BMG6_9BACT|nr:MFS transporter [Flaviaesturariibacter flavus]
MKNPDVPEVQPGAIAEEAALFPAHLKRTRLAVSAFYFGQGIAFASWASRIPDIKGHLHLGDAGLGTILLALPAGQLVTMPVSGRLVARWGSRRVLTMAAPLYVVALALIGLTNAPWQLAACLFLFGVMGNFANIAVNTQGVEAEKLYPKPIMTSFHGAWSIAGFTGALVGLLMINLHLVPWYHFLIITALVWLNVFFNHAFLVRGRPVAAEEAPKRRGFRKPSGVLLQLGLIAFCCMATEGCMFDWSGVYFRDIIGAQGWKAVIGYASFMVMMATGRFLGDTVIARMGRRTILRANGIIITMGMALAVFFPMLLPAALGFMLVGIGVSTVIPSLYSIAGRTASGSAAGIAIATVSGVGYLGFLMGPPLIGYISELSSLRVSLSVIGCFGMVVFLLVSKLKVVE